MYCTSTSDNDKQVGYQLPMIFPNDLDATIEDRLKSRFNKMD